VTDTVPRRVLTMQEGGAPPTVESRDLVVRTVALGGGTLSQALRAPVGEHVSAVAGWLTPAPRGVEAWAAHASAVRAAHATPDWHRALAPAFDAHGLAAERLGRAAASGVLVTTGQQPGLFGGATYTWTKAIGALALADELETALGIPVAPVFWAATDDADWAEAAVTHFLTASGLHTATLPGPPSDGVGMIDVPLGAIDDALAALRAACGSAAHRDVLDLIESAYQPHVTVGAAYLRLLRALLEPLGIAVLDASHPALRATADGFLRNALERSAAVAAALEERTAAIRAAGFVPQVETIETLSLVFQTGPAAGSADGGAGVRERVPVAHAAQVAREAAAGSLGANVLLRPVLERWLLPTVAYVAGPGEYAYFAQIPPLATALRVHAPMPVPRWAGEVIEMRSVRLRERLGIDEAMLRDPHEVETRLARAAMKEDVQDALERLRVTLETQTRALRSAVESADNLVNTVVVDGLARDLMHRVERFERRLVAGSKRREESLMRDIAHVRAAFRPRGTSPERVLNLMPVLVRHGPGVFAMMQRAASSHAHTLVHGGETGDFGTG
jgi:uncharacterized protein YllA (UPF0747 family)